MPRERAREGAAWQADKNLEAPLDLETLMTVVECRWAWKPESGEGRRGLGCSLWRQQGLTTLFRHVAVKERDGPVLKPQTESPGELGIKRHSQHPFAHLPLVCSGVYPSQHSLTPSPPRSQRKPLLLAGSWLTPHIKRIWIRCAWGKPGVGGQ